MKETVFMLFACIFVPDFSLQSLFAKRPELQTQAIALIDGTPPILKVLLRMQRPANLEWRSD